MAPASVVNCADFVSFVDRCQGPWAEFIWGASTSEGGLLLCEWALNHTHIYLFHEGLPDLGGEIFCRGVVVPAHGY